MGLDMYLIRKKYIGANYEHNQVKGKIEIEIRGKKIPIEFNRVTYIEEESCYWRKANAIHKWFVENVQDGNDDCRNYYVSTEDLKKLLDVCKKVKETAIIKKGKVQNGSHLENGEWVADMEDGEYIENADEIDEILPTTDGFFFGSTSYDQWYMKDIDYTIERLEQLLKEEKELNNLGFYSDFEYCSSW